MNNQLTSIRTTINNPINGTLFSDIKAEIGHSDEFMKQEEVEKMITRKINKVVEALLIEAFNDSKDENEKQGIIEAAQELGHRGLAVEFMVLL